MEQGNDHDEDESRVKVAFEEELRRRIEEHEKLKGSMTLPITSTTDLLSAILTFILPDIMETLKTSGSKPDELRERVQTLLKEHGLTFDLSNEADATILDVVSKVLQETSETKLQEMKKRIYGYVKSEPIQMWLDFPTAAMPTDLCRTSPFFPLNRKELSKPEYFKDQIITKTSWGELKFTGERLSVFDEDFLLAIVSFINLLQKDKERLRKQVPPQTYTGPVLPIFKLMEIENPAQGYERLRRSVDRLYAASFKLNETANKRNIPTLLFRIFEEVYYEQKITKSGQRRIELLHVKLDKNFYDLILGEGRHVTFLDVKRRAKIKGAVGKCLYRFIKSHRGDWSGGWTRLAPAINLNMEKPEKHIKEDIRRAIRELVRHGFLDKDSCIEKTGRVHLRKSAGKIKDEPKEITAESPEMKSAIEKLESPKQKSAIKKLARKLASSKSIPRNALNIHEWLVREQAKLCKEMKPEEWEHFSKSADWATYAKSYYRLYLASLEDGEDTKK